MVAKRLNPSRSRKLSLLVLVCVMVALLKFLLTAEEEIYPRYTPHDDLLYARLAEANYWNRPYDAQSLIRPPVYPLWIAATTKVGIRHRVAAEILYVSSAVLLAGVLWFSGMRWLLAAATCSAVALHPASIDQLNQLVRDGFYTSLLLAAAALFIWGLRRIPKRSTLVWLAGGFACACLWHTREEYALILVDVVIVLIVTAVLYRMNGIGMGVVARRVAVVALLLSTPIMIADSAIKAKTRSVHGVPIVAEIRSSWFRSAYDALLSVDPPHYKRKISITRETMSMVARHCPSFRAVKSQLDHGVAALWEKSFRTFAHVEGEIAGHGVMWALRNAASEAGHHESAKQAAAFYSQLAEEINGAIDDGRLPSRCVPISMVDPAIVQLLPDLPHAIAKLLSECSLRTFPSPVREPKRPAFPTPRSEATIRTYERAALLHRDLVGPLNAEVFGGIYLPQAELHSIQILSPSGEELTEPNILTQAHGDTAADAQERALKVPFHLSFPLIRFPEGVPQAVLLTRGGGGEKWVMPAPFFLREGIHQVALHGGSTCYLTVERATTVERRPSWKIDLQVAIRRTYFPAMVAAIVIALFLCAVRTSRRGIPFRVERFWAIAALLVGMMLLSRLLFLAVMDIAVFSHDTRHFFVCAIMLPVFLAILGQTLCITTRSVNPQGEESHSRADGRGETLDA